jgi:hypothetical protein
VSDSKRELAQLRDLTRLRAIRARLALAEATRLREVNDRAEAALRKVQHRRDEYLSQAERVAVWAAATPDEDGGTCLSAEHAQNLLQYTAALRQKAVEQEALIRRAESERDQTLAAAEEARAKHRHAAERQDALLAQWNRKLRADGLKRQEAEEEALGDERMCVVSTWRACLDEDG